MPDAARIRTKNRRAWNRCYPALKEQDRKWQRLRRVVKRVVPAIDEVIQNPDDPTSQMRLRKLRMSLEKLSWAPSADGACVIEPGTDESLIGNCAWHVIREIDAKNVNAVRQTLEGLDYVWG